MKKIYTIGRDPQCDIVIPDDTDVISRLHATLRIDDRGGYYLIDQSRNGTYVNGMKMSSNVEIPVTRQDVISFAHIYNLDWSVVPKARTPFLKNLLVILCSVVVLTSLTFGIILLFHKKGTDNPVEPASNSNSVSLPAVNPSNAPAKKDSVAVDDTVTVKRKATKKESSKQKADTVREAQKQQEQPEVIENPIY